MNEQSVEHGHSGVSETFYAGYSRPAARFRKSNPHLTRSSLALTIVVSNLGGPVVG